ncbi:hypothetical protein K8353_33725 [Burkholderia contaminans]|nr:hypothetical protein [Burkholderia contaminans]
MIFRIAYKSKRIGSMKIERFAVAEVTRWPARKRRASHSKRIERLSPVNRATGE